MRLCFPPLRRSLARLAPLVLAGLTWASAARSGGPVKHPATALLGGAGTGRVLGRSIGSPTEGHLLGGARLEESPYLRIAPVYGNDEVRWGLEALVSLIDHAARNVRKQFPDAVLSVGHLSRRGGGEVDRHASHESGRDADVGFYVKSYASKPIYADHFVAFRPDGTAPSWPGAHFDDARNWALVSSLVTDARARITYIFVAAPLRARLLAYAERTGASPAIRQRAAELMEQPRGSLPHDDHFHVRIACPAGMEGCIELPSAKHVMIARAQVDKRRGRGGSGGVVAKAAPARASRSSAIERGHPTSPRAALQSASPSPGTAPEMSPAETSPLPTFPEPSGAPGTGAPAAETSIEPPPPASLSTPVDDVDGPVP
jgi:penicillin-insensitive murein endopeptidase